MNEPKPVNKDGAMRVSLDTGGEAMNTINSNYHDNAMEEYTNNYDGNEMMPKLASAATASKTKN